MMRIVIDTSVFTSGLISSRGASHLLLQVLPSQSFEIALSVPLVIEYEATAKRLSGSKISLSESEIDDVIDYLCSIAKLFPIYFLWRPQLSDPNDDLVLELAVNSGSSHIVTFNARDFASAKHFAMQVISPQEFLRLIGAIQ
jgi:putative PIN family toxin of toxin-antitoxin system